MWPRKLDGSFNIKAVADHLLALVEQELSRERPELHVPAGVPAAASGLHVVHLVGAHLGVITSDSKAEALLDRIEDGNVRRRIDLHLGRNGLTDGDLRALSDAAQLSLSRAWKGDFEPFEPFSDQIFTVLAIGERKGKRIERRYVLVLDHRGDEIVLADPAGKGLAVITPPELNEAWKLGTGRGKPWVGFIGTR